jgi:hypothetical protein
VVSFYEVDNAFVYHLLEVLEVCNLHRVRHIAI